jgi:hypothetical protein
MAAEENRLEEINTISSKLTETCTQTGNNRFGFRGGLIVLSAKFDHPLTQR